ncbi:hypothetical protein ACGFNU_23235 [Spirillospora sp. NPDC048911]|uniref:hypothetical protein n=1 Tax=Spirillospora sp. NPDC048911 TaxID=3364527 RepID=UPI0037166793
MSIEDRLRDALQATAGTVDDQIHRPLPERTPAPSLLKRRLVPLGAVAAVLLVLAGFVTAQRLWDDKAPRLQRIPTMPKFIFMSTVDDSDDPNHSSYGLEVREAATGRLVDRYKAPRGISFDDVAALGDNRTFYVASEPSSQKPCRTTIQRVRVSDAGKIIALEPIAGGPIAGTKGGNGGLAVTPNGTKLAFSAAACGNESSAQEASVAVIDLVNNTRREWLGAEGGADDLSWDAGGNQLFFVHSKESDDPPGGPGVAEELRVISASVPSGAQLAANSKVIQKIKAPLSYVAALASPDGRSVLTSTQELIVGSDSSENSEHSIGVLKSTEAPSGPIEFSELSARDGRTIRKFRVASTASLGVVAFKSDASGLYLLTSGGIVDLHKGGRALPVRGLDDEVDLDW